MTSARRIQHRANVKARYHGRKAPGPCVDCEVKRDTEAGDTTTQCRGCANYKNEKRKVRES